MKGTTDPREPDGFGGVADHADLSPPSPTPEARSYWGEACRSYQRVLTLEVDIGPVRTPGGPPARPVDEPVPPEPPRPRRRPVGLVGAPGGGHARQEEPANSRCPEVNHMAWRALGWALAVGLVVAWVVLLHVPGAVPWLFVAVAAVAAVVVVITSVWDAKRVQRGGGRYRPMA
jgi:hypothetical protein